MIDLQMHGSTAEVTIRADKALNPFTMEMTRQLTRLCRELEQDDRVNGVLLWGGPERSFSVGGDFNEVQQLTSFERTRKYAYEIIASYKAVLEVSKPLVAAIDHYAIGLGLQVALMSDWRVGTHRSSYHMPELKGGLACPMGSTILETMFGRAVMLELVVGCEGLSPVEARRIGLIQEVCAPETLRDTALARLETFAGFPALPYRETKRYHNGRFVQKLDDIIETAARIHWTCFEAGQQKEHFAKVLHNEN